MMFAIVAAVLAACAAYLVAIQNWPMFWRLPAPRLKEDFDVAAYTGVPWAVQATLVALVYPIVLSFIALLLQRKAHSTVSLRAYVLDSGVAPAGSSSIGLLVFMGAEYFAAPYSSSNVLAPHMAALLAFNGAWLLINVLLTGFFLSRTIRFVQEDEQRHVFTRVAVDVALRSELTSAVMQHILVNAPQSEWSFPTDDAASSPQVLMFELHKGRAEVVRVVKGKLVLHDVHLRLLNLVARRWYRRAAQALLVGEARSPQLSFPPIVGADASGETVLCSVHNGPPLGRVERALVRAAFLYRPSRQTTLSLSTRKMLEEVAAEVEAAADQQRFGVAEERLQEVVALHKSLLLASAVATKGVPENAATIGTSPYSWGESSFDIEWLKPYRDIGRIAVNWLDVDARLFRRLAVVPASIVRSLPPKPEKLLIDAQLVGTNLAYQLAGWWTRKADESVVPGTSTFSGTLPPPLNKVYEQAVISFIGSWDHIRVGTSDIDGDEEDVWQALASAARVYATHIENTAALFLKAVSRGDVTGGSRLLDSFLKWWGNRRYEFECADIEDDYRTRHVTLTLAEKTWPQAQDFLWDGAENITIDFGRQALHLAIRRYWESVRLYLVLLLIENAGSNPAAGSLELRYASALVKASPLYGGGQVEASALDSVDAVLRGLLAEVNGIETALARIDSFADKLSWENEAPEVSGWLYSWSHPPTNLESMVRAQAILLVSIAAGSNQQVGASKTLVERWWKDIDKLESVNRQLQVLRREVLSASFVDAVPLVSELQSQLHKHCPVRTGRLGVARAVKQLSRVAEHERRLTLRSFPVAEDRVQDFGKRVGVVAFDVEKLPPPIEALRFTPGGLSTQHSVVFQDEKKRYLVGVGNGADDGLIERVGESVREMAVAWAFHRTVVSKGLKPVNNPTLRNDFNASHAAMQGFASAVAAHCAALRAVGEQPVVLVGRSAPAVYLRPYKWGSASWQCPLPPGVTIRQADGGLGRSFINDAPVFDFETPDTDCYVVPASWLSKLVVQGADAGNGASIRWNQLTDTQLEFRISWSAEFQ
ncbi:hypothetical protein [Ralstonia pseudosolanacearum]|uniref:hypothetical protein n=2 Tax=Ralstonia pseudosolanacearum TaxID=1310165 RepID=UPI0011B54A0A|nr:hypothetical protein [Ralstonia pseudosolanacearum]